MLFIRGLPFDQVYISEYLCRLALLPYTVSIVCQCSSFPGSSLSLFLDFSANLFRGLPFVLYTCTSDVAPVFQSENRCRNQGLLASYICVVGNVYGMLFSFVAMDHLCRCFSIKLSGLDSSAWLLCV